jgi:phospholipase/lecithinase/hemolysin
MAQHVKRFLAAMISAFLLLLPGVAMAASSFNSIIAFGDSLSDNGSSTDGFGIAHFTDGPTWVEDLAQNLNVPLIDMAVGGAKTGTDNIWAATHGITPYAKSGLLNQVDYYLSNYSNSFSSDSLVTLWAGANDFLFNTGDTPVSSTNNVMTALQKLIAAGADNILVLNLPDMGASPYFSEANPSMAPYATGWSQAFNALLAQDIMTLKLGNPDENIFTLDMYTLFAKVEANPTAYGLTDAHQLFWVDGLHPSAAGHDLIADYAKEALPTPEPATIILVLTGIGGAFASRRKK